MSNKQWNYDTVSALYNKPFFDLIYTAYSIHKEYFDSSEMELCTLLNIKTGACPEDCAYCTQSGHYKTGLKKEKLWEIESILEKAKEAKAAGSTRFCMGAAWRSPPEKDFPKIIEIIKAVKALGLETCVTLGMLEESHVKALEEAGLDFYNHNLDTSREHYEKIITTRTYDDRLQTLEKVRKSRVKICCGGIIGLGESRKDRINLLLELANLPEPPTSVPINQLMPMSGTPLENVEKIDHFEFIRTVAVTRILLPTSRIRLSAGRENMSEEMQAWCFMAGANSIFCGEKLLTTKNPSLEKDSIMFKKLGLKAIKKDHKIHAE